LITAVKPPRESVSLCCKAQPAGNNGPYSQGVQRGGRGLQVTPFEAFSLTRCNYLTGCRHAGVMAPCQARRLAAKDLSTLNRASLLISVRPLPVSSTHINNLYRCDLL